MKYEFKPSFTSNEIQIYKEQSLEYVWKPQTRSCFGSTSSHLSKMEDGSPLLSYRITQKRLNHAQFIHEHFSEIGHIVYWKSVFRVKVGSVQGFRHSFCHQS